MIPTEDQINWAVAELLGYKGIGYYGPTKSHGMHTDQERFDTKKEAHQMYMQYWRTGERGYCQWDDDKEDEISLCYWKEGWGTCEVSDYYDNPANIVTLLNNTEEAIRDSYLLYLVGEKDRITYWDVLTATPYQHCMAFLKSHGKWTDDWEAES